MKHEPRVIVLALAVLASACSSTRLRVQSAAEVPAIRALQLGDFAGASRGAQATLRDDPRSSRGALVRALTRYRASMHQLGLDFRTVLAGAALAGGVNHRYLRSSMEQGEASLAAVEDDLAIAARDRDLALDLCVACWEIDWNGNGRVDERDRLLFQIEQDADGKPIPEGDPRRKPTFRFDHGDVEWARAFVAFQRVALDLLLAYDWSALDPLLAERHEVPHAIRIRLEQPERLEKARALILDGLARSEAARRAYLAERDDEREWVPSPRQKSHPLPLPVDDALYETWRDVIGDVERLVRGQEGLSLAEVSRLIDPHAANVPRGYLDLGRMLSHPRDIVLDLRALEAFERKHDTQGALESLLGDYLVPRMKPSPLPTRLERMKAEVDRGNESVERKLRYLFWIN